MCNDLGAVLLTEDGGKQAGCYSWNLKQNNSFPLKTELLSHLALGQARTNRFTLGKKKV